MEGFNGSIGFRFGLSCNHSFLGAEISSLRR